MVIKLCWCSIHIENVDTNNIYFVYLMARFDKSMLKGLNILSNMLPRLDLTSHPTSTWQVECFPHTILLVFEVGWTLSWVYSMNFQTSLDMSIYDGCLLQNKTEDWCGWSTVVLERSKFRQITLLNELSSEPQDFKELSEDERW